MICKDIYTQSLIAHGGVVKKHSKITAREISGPPDSCQTHVISWMEIDVGQKPPGLGRCSV